MNTTQDPLDALLRNDAAAMRDAYIDDAGFSSRVVDALPATRRLPRVIRRGVPLAFTITAAAGVARFTAGGDLAIDAFMDLATQTITANAIGMLLIIAVVIAVSLANISHDA